MKERIAGSMNAGLLEDIDLYRFFAHVLGFPTQDRFSLLSLAELRKALQLLWTELGCQGEAPHPSKFDNFEQYESTYIALFDVGFPEPPVPLLESAYHKAIPAQHTVLENTDYFEVLGLKPSASFTAPDHVVTQLEFLASARYLQENCEDESKQQNLRRLEQDFLDRHLLCWIPNVLARLQELKPPLFPALFTLLLQFLRNRRDLV
jgi:DMSO reductase family type II enzyme chaperone